MRFCNGNYVDKSKYFTKNDLQVDIYDGFDENVYFNFKNGSPLAICAFIMKSTKTVTQKAS